MPCHENEDLPHYHLLIRDPRASLYEIPVLFRDDCVERGVVAATVGNIKTCVRDLLGLHNVSLSWKGVLLGPDTTLVRDLCVDGCALALYVPNKADPIIVNNLDM